MLSIYIVSYGRKTYKSSSVPLSPNNFPCQELVSTQGNGKSEHQKKGKITGVLYNTCVMRNAQDGVWAFWRLR